MIETATSLQLLRSRKSEKARTKARTPFQIGFIDEPLQWECEEERLWRMYDGGCYTTSAHSSGD